MRRVKLKQGTLAWEKARETRIGSSEIFDIVKYYAADDELQNCGINAEDFRAEKPYTTAWALYHKMIGDGLYAKEELEPEFAEYGHSVEPYGVYILQRGREKRLKPSEVYVSDKLIASLDIAGVAEECDTLHAFDYGHGTPKIGQRFVCEQKTMMPQMVKNGLPFKYIVQAQYQILQTKADFFILQIMILNDDTAFNRGKICQMSRSKKFQYLDDNMTVGHYYFRNNVHLSRLIEVCIERFFNAVEKKEEPMPFLSFDSQQNIIESIRLNSAYNDEMVFDYDLNAFVKAKEQEEVSSDVRKAELQKIIETAKKHNVCRFCSPDGFTASFSKNGRFLVKPPAKKGVIA